MTGPGPQAAAPTSPGLPATPARTRLSGPELTGADFERIAAVAYEAAGLAIGPGKSAMVRTRLARRLRVLNLPNYSAYCTYLDGENGAAEIGMLVSALTTNVSHFFRESHHFDLLRDQVLPSLIARARSGTPVRVWSAGCANGQEAYSILMTMADAGMPLDRDVRVLATDIDPNVIRHACAGIYPGSMLSGLPEAQRTRHFDAYRSPDGPSWRIKDTLRAAARFRVLNLLDDWPMRGRFDAIFCRNVVIYFDAATKDRLWRRFSDQLAPGGWLFIGHSERLSGGVQGRFSPRGITAHQHVDRPPAETRAPDRSREGY